MASGFTLEQIEHLEWGPKPLLPRAVSAGAVLLLHAALLLALIWTHGGAEPQSQPRERTIWFNMQKVMHPTATKRSQEAKPQSLPSPLAQSRSNHPSKAPAFLLPIEPNQKGLSGARDPFLDCSPENITNLDEAQRSQCLKLGAYPNYDPNAVDYADRINNVPGAPLWKRELARKKAPLLLPCGNAVRADIVYTGACILGNIANGFTFKQQYQNQRGYGDKPAGYSNKPGRHAN